ncbi:MAG TPA: hypothetical protein VM165_03455, partial [Planctomycetaceae bacterium]|nr:hypothetical protein [Planctomycetaceae bacterium]
MTISDVLQVQDVAIGEAHGIPGGRKMWWLPVAHGTAYIDVEATEDNQLLLVSISTGPSSAELDGDLAVIRSIVVQIVPQDGWFAGDWFSAPVQDL